MEPKHRSRQFIKSFESSALKKRPFIIRVADLMTNFFGSLIFLGLNIVGFIVWILINSNNIPQIAPFDPYPFNFLTMTVSLEAIVLSIIVLVTQKRQSQIDSLREELHLQVNLIAEREITEALRLLDAIADKTGVKHVHSPELVEMLKDTDTSYIERKLEKELEPKTINNLLNIKKK